MKLALICDDYLPHSTRVGAKMIHELAKELVDQGHQVTVITPKIKARAPLLLEDNLDGVVVWRFRCGPIKDVGKITRAINESLLSRSAWRAIRRLVKEHTFDGVIYYSPSIFFGSLVAKIKKRCRCKSYLVLRDFFPQWAVDSGLIRQGSLIERYFSFFESQLYKNADSIGVMSQGNLDIFNKKTCYRFRASILRNWASIKSHQVSDNSESLRVNLGLLGKIIYFYGGNIGHAQDMENLMRLVRSMQTYDDVHFLFIGQGDEVQLIKDLAAKWQLRNFSYLPSVSQDKFKDILCQVDVGLFSLSAKHTAHNFPGKLLGYMVQSVPILGSVNQDNDLVNLLKYNNAGLVSINGDDESLLANAVALYESRDLRRKIGLAGYDLLKKEFAVASVASTIVRSFWIENESF